MTDTTLSKKNTVRQTRWSFSVEEKDIHLVEETSNEGKWVTTEDSSKYKYYIGKIKEASDDFPWSHRLGMLYSEKSITKTKTTNILQYWLNILTTEKWKIMPLTLSDSKCYLATISYTVNCTKSEPEEIIKKTIKDLEANNCLVTTEKLHNVIKERNGIRFFKKNKDIPAEHAMAINAIASKVWNPPAAMSDDL